MSGCPSGGRALVVGSVNADGSPDQALQDSDVGVDLTNAQVAGLFLDAFVDLVSAFR
jgi:hypothetical protein